MEDGAIIADGSTGRFLDHTKVHYVDFSGEHFAIKGPALLPRPPQGQVVVFAAPGTVRDGLADVLVVSGPTEPELLNAARSIRTTTAARVFADIEVALDTPERSAGERVDGLDRSTPWQPGQRLRLIGSPDELVSLVSRLAAHVDGIRLLPAVLDVDVPTIARAVIPALRAAGVLDRDPSVDHVARPPGPPPPDRPIRQEGIMSTDAPPQLHLAAFFPFGPHYVWSEAARNDIYYDFDAYAQLARTAERGLFTAVFLGDSQRLREHLGRITDTAVTGRPDQLVLFAYLAAVTERIGLVATLNTTYTDPVDLARRIATIDTLSGGRAGWNLVTTDNGWTGANFRKGGYLANRDRYRQADEHLAICRALWDGWTPGAETPTATADTWAAPASIPTVRFDGAFYDVEARPSVPPTPQVQPVLFQAGESDEGRDFAARHAEAIFSRYLDFDAALEFANDMRARLVRAGRPADDLRIFPAARITLGDTTDEAIERSRCFQRATWTDRSVLAVIESVWGRDLSAVDPDGPLPADDPVTEEQTKTHGVVNSRDQPLRTAAQWRTLTEAKGWSIRQLVTHLTGSIEFVGTPNDVADELARYVHAGALGGLNLVPDSVPGGFDDVVDRLVPVLQERGIYPTEYAGATLRENLRLRACRPPRQELAAATSVRVIDRSTTWI